MNNVDARALVGRLQELHRKAGYDPNHPNPRFEVIQRAWVNTDLISKAIPAPEKRHKGAALTDGRWIYAVFQPIITFRETAELIAEVLNVLPELLTALEVRCDEN
jgi:hypothetical protein